MTREYEVVYIFSSTHKRALAADGAEITAVEHWGKRQLAYPIDGHLNGNYVVAQFSTGPEALPEFERGLRLDEEVLRYLVVLSEGELPTPPSARFEKDEGESRPHDEGSTDEPRAKTSSASEESEETEAASEVEAESDGDDAEAEASAESKVEVEADEESPAEAQDAAEAEGPAEDDETDTVADPVEAGAAEED
jgi:small subunit ribosomal protein S6